jgi:hypothetical protein
VQLARYQSIIEKDVPALNALIKAAAVDAISIDNG